MTGAVGSTPAGARQAAFCAAAMLPAVAAGPALFAEQPQAVADAAIAWMRQLPP